MTIRAMEPIRIRVERNLLPVFGALPLEDDIDAERIDDYIQQRKADGVVNATIFAALYTGMRTGELLKLTWPQVDLANRTLDFELSKRGRTRLLPIAESLYYVLARLRGSGGHADTDRVFLRADARPWNKWAVENRFAKAVKAAQIPAIRFHDLRQPLPRVSSAVAFTRRRSSAWSDTRPSP